MNFKTNFKYISLALLFCFSLAIANCGDDNGFGTCGQGNLIACNDYTYTAAVCGNGVVEVGEECDKGADNSNSIADACRPDCKLPFCGDGVQDTGEECDDGDGNSDTMPDACRATTCALPSCGDGVVDVIAGEECEGNTPNCANDASFCDACMINNVCP